MPRVFEEIKESLLERGELFEDEDFPADYRSLGNVSVKGRVVWKRPKEISPNPRFVVNKSTRLDLIQGELSDCWFISAAACLAAEDESMLERCVPSDQQLDKDYAGIFKFCFWNFGSWCDVYIDDRLPTVNGKLVFARNEDEPDEFWVPLFEKAYAKLKGKYSDLDGGQTTYALVDFTGGISERVDLKEKRLMSGKLFDTMIAMMQKSSLMGCEIPARMGKMEAKLSSGLYTGHAYSITKIMSVNTKYGGRSIKLLRIRNPWGQGEWNGDWSDNSTKWDIVTEETKKELQLLRRDNGEFWMSFEDWLSNFEYLTICHLDPSCITAELGEKHKGRSAWETQSWHAEWIKGYNAGGSSLYSFKREKFFSNPQLKISLKQIPGDRDNGQKTCHVIVSLMQLVRNWDEQNVISFDIYQVRKDVPEPEGRNYNGNELVFVKKGPTPTNLREVTGHYEFPAGEYIIVPHTFNADINAKFFLRVFTEYEPDQGSQGPTTIIPSRPQSFFEEDMVRKVTTEHFKWENQDREDMDDRELLQVLDHAFRIGNIAAGFHSLEAARCLVTQFGKTTPGVLNFEEFYSLWKEIGLWIEKFITYDMDRSGTIDCDELKKVYISIGLQLNSEVLNALVCKYGGRAKKITPDEFILCSCKIKNTYEHFKKLSGDRKLRMNLEEWMSMALSF